MDINTRNSSGMMNGIPPTPHTEKKVGPIVGALIIVLILIIAALYFFGKKLNTESVPPENAPAQTTSANTQTNTQAPASAQTGTTGAMSANANSSPSSSDDVATLQADLNSQLQNVDYSF